MNNFVVNFDPNIFKLGPIAVRWYGAMYVVGFILAGYILGKLVERGFFKVEKKKIDSLITTMMISMFVGARIFYVFVYNWKYYSNNLSEIPAIWQGGLSFHGAIIGLVVGSLIFARRNKIHFIQVLDNACVAGAPSLFFGRLGNFINGELYGRVTNSPIGMIFPSGGPYPRHPSQLYEGILEGLVTALILYFVMKKSKSYGYVTGAFLISYGIFRYFVEFFREADTQLGYFFGNTTTMGQILCILMVMAGTTTIFMIHKNKINN